MVVSKRASIGGGTFSVGLHTDQQSLILGEMMTARTKLQEENQILRDKLQDSEMMVRILLLKLAEHDIKFDVTKAFGVPMDDRAVPDNSTCLPRKALEKAKTKTTNRNAFRNQFAPGKKTFESNAIKISATPGVPQSPTGRSDKVHTMSCSPDSRCAEPEEKRVAVSRSRSQNNQNIRNNAVSAVGSREIKKSSSNGISSNTKSGSIRYKHSFGVEQFPGDAQQLRSVIGKLAQVVINEYSITEDDDNIVFE
jgi:hypothetical protein